MSDREELLKTDSMHAEEFAILKLLEEPFDASQIRTRDGRGGIKLNWVDARTVAERLDSALGIGGWEWRVERQQDGVVLGTLSVHLPSGKTIVRQDWGYMTGGSGEDLKEAASDALRRAASLFGVGRALYQHGAEAASVVAKPESTRQVAVNREMPSIGERIEGVAVDFMNPEAVKSALEGLQGVDGGACGQHGTPWTLKPAGVSKAGKPYNAFYTCTGKNADGSYCREKPGAKWVASQKAPVPKLVPEESFEDLPF